MKRLPLLQPNADDRLRAQDIRRALEVAGLSLEKTVNNEYNLGIDPALALAVTCRAIEESGD